MVKVKIHTVDGAENASITVEFSTGEVGRDKVSEDGNKTTMIAGVGVEGTLAWYKNHLYECAEAKDWEEFENALEQYDNLLLLKTIGVKQSPLKIDSEGNLEGMVEDAEIEFEEGTITLLLKEETIREGAYGMLKEETDKKRIWIDRDYTMTTEEYVDGKWEVVE